MAPKLATDIYEWAYGTKFHEASLDGVARELLDAGEGAVGILQIERPLRRDAATGQIGRPPGHVAAVTVRHGLAIYIEGQRATNQRLGRSTNWLGSRRALATDF